MAKNPVITNRTELTTWSCATYDVWGNTKEGYDNNGINHTWNVQLDLHVELNNPGTNRFFVSAFPTDKQIKDTFGVNCHLDILGDDTHIYINRSKDSYPIGEMICESHESLSPIRRRKD